MFYIIKLTIISWTRNVGWLVHPSIYSPLVQVNTFALYWLAGHTNYLVSFSLPNTIPLLITTITIISFSPTNSTILLPPIFPIDFYIVFIVILNFLVDYGIIFVLSFWRYCVGCVKVDIWHRVINCSRYRCIGVLGGCGLGRMII